MRRRAGRPVLYGTILSSGHVVNQCDESTRMITEWFDDPDVWKFLHRDVVRPDPVVHPRTDDPPVSPTGVSEASE